MKRHPQQFVRLLAAIFLLLTGLMSLALLFTRPVTADAASLPAATDSWQTAIITPTHNSQDLACVLCHSETDAAIVFPSGEALPVQVDAGELRASAHGFIAENPLACTDCHRPIDRYQFPHPPVTAETFQEYHIDRAATCETCHQQPHLTSHPGPDAPEPVVCTDCHGAHDVQTAAAWHTGRGIGACVACHQERQVALTNANRLTEIVRAGLFADRPDNDYCLSCHSQPDFTLTFPSGESISLTIDREAFHDSVHGVGNSWDALQCNDCHEGYLYPHPPVTAESARLYTLEKYTICADCHEVKYEEALDSVHALALAEGNLEAAVCTDCHGAHDTPPPAEPRSRIPATCGQCHDIVFDEYVQSVHGETLLAEPGNADVPTCIECHGVHNINDPTTALFRIRSPELCATCHADPEMMNRYDVSTDVFDTYVADFHGTTVTLFANLDPTVETNKAVCYDCHGVHDIRRPDDPHAGIKANLLATCQQCHPDATANFPDSWTSHFRPSLQHNPLVYLVNLFYQLVIPATLVFLGFLISTDVYRRARLRIRPVPPPQEPAETPAIDEHEATAVHETADDAPNTAGPPPDEPEEKANE
jgi:predicted CXXCH cytochrome family protein